MFRSVFTVQNAWRVRIVALGCIVLFIGVGSQVLVNALAASSGPDPDTIKVTASPFAGRMTDGNWSYAGACIVSTDQFPLGSIIALYNNDGSLAIQCTAEDSNAGISYGQVSLIIPGDSEAVQHWGTQFLEVRVLRNGWGNYGLLAYQSSSLFHAHKPPSHFLAPHK